MAALCMVWSLCVLALPIGVIGNNFGKVWDEYDQEKQLRKEIAKSETKILEKSQCFIDPLAPSRRLFIELWHDSNMGSEEAANLNHTFIGEASLSELHLPKDDAVSNTLILPVKANPSKAKRKVFGQVTISWTWTPQRKLEEAGVYVAGQLKVQILKAEGLQPLDWKGGVDPFCTVSCYPRSADEDGNLKKEVYKTETVRNDRNPAWNEEAIFDYHWCEAGLEAKKRKEQHIDDSSLGKALLLAHGTVTTEDPCDKIMSQLLVLPRLQDELREMKTMLADLKKAVVPAPSPPGSPPPPQTASPTHLPVRTRRGSGSKKPASTPLGALQDPFQEPDEKNVDQTVPPGEVQNGKNLESIVPGCVDGNLC